MITAEALEQLRAHPCVSAIEQHDDGISIRLLRETDTAPLVSLLVNAGAQVEEVRRGKASLEDVFVTLMEEDQ